MVCNFYSGHDSDRLPVPDFDLRCFTQALLHWGRGDQLGEEHAGEGGGEAILGPQAAEEFAEGVHGHNRLGRKPLLEYTVFVRIVGKKVHVVDRQGARVN